MRAKLTITTAVLLAACGQSDKQQLREAANQSDPDSAAVLNNAAENGMDPQEALREAGRASSDGNADSNAQ